MAIVDTPVGVQQSAHSNRKRGDTRRRELIVVVESNNKITDIDESEPDKLAIPINQASLVVSRETLPEIDKIQFMPPINQYFRIDNK